MYIYIYIYIYIIYNNSAYNNSIIDQCTANFEFRKISVGNRNWIS